MLEELSFIAQADFLPGLVNIVDDAFNLIPRRAERICKGLLENRIRLQMHCLARCDLVNEDLLRLMYEAGFVALGISLESAVPRVLRAIGKVSPPGTHSDPGLTRERGYIEAVARCVGLARKIGFHRVAVSIMVGLPGESVSEAQQTLEFVKALGVDFYYHSALRIYPGTPLFEEHARYGYGMDDLDGVLPFPGTSHPYPVESRVRPVAGLSLEDPRRRDSEAMGVLSLLPVRKEARGCFNNVVLFSENLTEDLVRWMKKNLALSGRLIHLYRNPESEPDPRDVEKFLHRWGSPTLDYRPLRVVDDAGGDLVQFCHETSRFFQVKLAVSTREDAGARVEGSPFFLALRDMDDVEIFCRFIEAQNRAPDTFQSLSGLNDVPLVERLCMWLGSAGANCHTFETALVDEDGKVRLCGQADPSGTLGDGFSALRRNFSRQKEESSRRRSCAACEVRARCIQCPFPAPLNESAYCVQRRLLGEESAAEALHVILRSRFARLLGPWRCTENGSQWGGPCSCPCGSVAEPARCWSFLRDRAVLQIRAYGKGWAHAMWRPTLRRTGTRPFHWSGPVLSARPPWWPCCRNTGLAVIGFTVYNDNYYACKAVAEAAKAARPGMLCVFGGPTPTVVPEAVLRDAPCVDVCVRGRGEDALLEILDALSEHGDPFCSGCLDAFAKVAGINFRRDGCLQATPEADFPQRGRTGPVFFLDRYPSPYLTGFLAPEAAVSAGVTTARGCNQHCTYCNCAVLWKNRIYPHSVERVLEELDWLSRSEYVAGVVRICDDAFNLMPRRGGADLQGDHRQRHPPFHGVPGPLRPDERRPAATHEGSRLHGTGHLSGKRCTPGPACHREGRLSRHPGRPGAQP